jgi:hypothetical protein
MTKFRPKLTGIITFHYIDSDGNGIPMDRRWSTILNSDEQPWGPRKLIAAEKWLPLETGWIKNAGLLLISNSESARDSQAGTLEICYHIAEPQAQRDMLSAPQIPPSAQWLVPPGHAYPGMFADVSRLLIRASKGQVHYSLMVYPR